MKSELNNLVKTELKYQYLKVVFFNSVPKVLSVNGQNFLKRNGLNSFSNAKGNNMAFAILSKERFRPI